MRFRNRNGSAKKRTAMTIIETGFAIVIGLVVIAGAIAGYKKLYMPMKGDAAYSQIDSVIGAIERVKVTNGNVYPVAAGTMLSAQVLLVNEMGGAANMRDVAAWTYRCAAGSAQTLTLVTTAYDDVTIAQSAAAKIVNGRAPWTATAAATGVVTITIPRVVCQ